MGSAFSFLISSTEPIDPSLGDLPESCVASVLVYMDPPEICKLSMLNRAFRGASSADFVWESKLPLNYSSIIQRVQNFPNNLCKRDIYARLCRPNSFDGGTKVQSLSLFLLLNQDINCVPKNSLTGKSVVLTRWCYFSSFMKI